MLQRAAKILEAVEAFFDHVDARRVAEPHRSIVAECGSGNDCDIGFAQQTIGEILRTQAELADVDQHVKRPLWLDRGHVLNFRDAIEHVIAAHIEFVAHIGERLLVTFKRGDRAFLRE